MARVSKRSSSQARSQFSIGNLLGLFVMVALMVGAFFYSFVALTSGDWRWFDTSFEAMPQRIAIIDRGQRTELDPSDSRFAPLAAAFNQTIEQGYRHASLGFSRETWADVDREGLLVETSYVQPVQLHIHGGFHPTNRLLLLIDGKNLHTTQVLFRRNPNDWDPIPLIVNTVEPLKGELQRLGFGAAR
jgi:hypothetical protein